MKPLTKIDKIEIAGYALIMTVWMAVMVIAAIHHAHSRVVAPASYPKPSASQPVVPFTNDDTPLGPMDVPGAVSSQQREIENGGDEP